MRRNIANITPLIASIIGIMLVPAVGQAHDRQLYHETGHKRSVRPVVDTKPDLLKPAFNVNLLSPALDQGHRSGVGSMPSSVIRRDAIERLGGNPGPYGKELVRLLDTLPDAPDGLELGRVNWWMALSGVNERMAQAISDPKTVLPDLPHHKETVARHGRVPEGLKGALVRWPMRGNTVTALLQSGFDPARTTLYTDKIHFTDPRAVVVAKAAGFGLRGARVATDTAFLHDWIRKGIRSLSPSEQRSTKPLFVLLDDSGNLLRHAVQILKTDPELRAYGHLFAGVEQTGSGSNALKQLELPLHVVDNARSDWRMEMGGPIYGHAIVAQGLRHRAELEAQGVKLGRTVAVLGSGSIGVKMASILLKAGYDVRLFDTDPRILSAASKALTWFDRAPHEGTFTAASTKLEAIREADVVFTASAGKRALGGRDLETLAQMARQRGERPRVQLWVEGGSVGEIERVRGARYRPPSLHVARGDRGSVQALVQGQRVRLGFRGSGPDRDRLIEHDGWQVIVARSGHVINGRTDVTGNRFEIWGSKLLGPADLRRAAPAGAQPFLEDPVAPSSVELDLSQLHLSTLKATQGGPPGIEPLPNGLETPQLEAFSRYLNNLTAQYIKPAHNAPFIPVPEEQYLTVMEQNRRHRERAASGTSRASGKPRLVPVQVERVDGVKNFYEIRHD